MNERRIVACVNACAGVSTEELEFAAARPLDKQSRLNEIAAQREELTAVLREILAFDSMDYSMHIKGMQRIAKAALAKVQS